MTPAVDWFAGATETERLGPTLWVLKLSGEHDLATSAEVDAAFNVFEETGTTVLVDFSDTTFVDSTIINTLIRRLRGGETLLLVLPAESVVRRTLDLVGVTELFTTFETREAALQAVPIDAQRTF